MKIEIRKATLKDLDEILKLNRELFVNEHDNFDKTIDVKWSLGEEHREYYLKGITSKNRIEIVALVDGRIVGYLAGSVIKADEWRTLKKLVELDDMFVLENYRSYGIGSKLFSEFVKWAKSKKVERMKVLTSFSNERAIGFYKKNGFSEYDLILEGELK